MCVCECVSVGFPPCDTQLVEARRGEKEEAMASGTGNMHLFTGDDALPIGRAAIHRLLALPRGLRRGRVILLTWNCAYFPHLAAHVWFDRDAFIPYRGTTPRR